MTSLINTEIQPFQATAFHQGQFVPVSDADLRGHWSVVFFYPADFTFVCPTELGDLADHYADLQAMGVEVYSVSTDTHFTHKAWHDTSDTIGKIQFPMIGDPAGVITNNFGVMRPGAGLADRATFVIDPQGVVQVMEITSGSGSAVRLCFNAFSTSSWTVKGGTRRSREEGSGSTRREIRSPKRRCSRKK